MKTHLYLKLALFFTALLLFTCQHDDAVFQPQTEEITKALYQQRSVSLKELPKVKSLIDSYSNLSLSRSETTGDTPIFDMEHILELIDTLNNTNYAFNFRYADTPIGEFYNLIIGKNPDGQLRTPYVLKYKCDESQLETYIANNFQFSSFKGAVSLHRYTDFFELGTFGVRGDPNCPKLDAVGDPIPCETQPIDGGGSGGIGDGGIDGPDSGTGNTGTTDYGGSFTCTYLGIFVTGCNGTNTESLHAIGSCRGPDLDSATQTGVWDCSSGFDQEAPPNTVGMSTENDCPECDSGNGGVPVNPISIETMRSTLKYNLNLSKAGLSYIGKSENNEEVTRAFNYLVLSGIDGNYTAEAKAFDKQAIEALADGAVVDFNRQIIIDSTIPPCVENILKDLIDDNTYIDLGDMPEEIKRELNLSGFILDLFNNSDKFSLVFKTASLGTNSAGQSKNAQTYTTVNTSVPRSIIINITLDSSYISNATDLSIARSIIHESIHAYILYIYQTNIFDDLSQAYTKLLSDAGYPSNTNPAQHQLMANKFVDAIANSLANWDNNSIADSNYYNYLSWSGGMLATETFLNKSAEFQQNSINANIAEGNAGPNGNYSSNNAKGTKNCN